MRRHWQRDLRWFSVYVGFDISDVLFGVRLKRDEYRAGAIGLGPLYVGIGGYDSGT